MEKIFIIGAPRSGTNMLRDVLCSIKGVGTWPCDEINYIWRHGNANFPSDEFLPEMATFDISKFIRKEFDRIACKKNLETIVEKTCANSLRVGFVYRIFPEARFIFIYRNGVDASSSAKRRWSAKLVPSYILRKARFVPTSDFHYYAWRYFKNRVHLIISKEKQLATWGPMISDMDNLTKRLELIQVCGKQWEVCVLNAKRDLDKIPEKQIFNLSYEKFVNAPERYLKKICQFAEIKVEESSVSDAVSNVSTKNIGKGKKELNEEELNLLKPNILKGMKVLGYDL